MRKKTIISMMIILILILGQGVVKAANSSITASGESKVKAGETGTVTINVTSGDAKAGVVSGSIGIDDNMESVEVKGINSWNLTYNDETGQFNLVKAAGADSDTEACLTISYTIKSSATGTASVTMSDLNVTSIEYETESVSNVTKDITIEVDAQKGQTSNTDSSTTTTNGNTSKDASTATKKIPQTGISSIILIVAAIILVNGIIMLIRHKKMKY